MKSTLITLLLSLLLFSCRNSETPAASTTKSDTTKSALTKLIKNSSSSKVDSNDLYQALTCDSINESDVLVDGYPILSIPEQKAVKLLNLTDGTILDSNKKDTIIIKHYNIKESSFEYWNGKLFHLRILDNNLSFSVFNKKMKIGDDIEKLKTIFPNSFSYNRLIQQENPE